MTTEAELIEGAPLWPKGPTSLMHLIRRAAQRTALCWGEEVSSGLSQVQYAALIVLDEMETCDQQTLCSRVGIDKATGTYVVEKMVQADLVAARPDPENRRRKLITLTRDGRKALETTIPQARRANTQVGANLSAEEREQLGHLLSRLAGVREIDA
ncbi:MarR family winged helix-turn-helix transcriptional regulator [Stenotrophomonas tuberculopleuritidis]|uniref:MarR family winged helix-turn-helix transcriptional regulator n=1 Tax=Stenotrophomonas tuberculopleuritidis TaxID=3055079 RepID=UPI0026E542BD|nr:MarR family winged helix-turn-helix transcriptional regulator [Stenotrophomonas sp. 704A1]